MRSIEPRLRKHQRACAACRVCEVEGLIPRAAPVFQGGAEAVFLLVGQAPGPVELDSRRPFSGRAGKELARWALRAGFGSDDEFRRVTYVAAMMRCFPGRLPSGQGDRPPPRKAVANCAHWLDAELELLDPKVVIAVGQHAISRFLGPGPLEERVGATFGTNPVVLPLPHPSGQSRWLNSVENRERLDRALALLSDFRERWAGAA
jgi:uracil-DNA glycosylase